MNGIWILLLLVLSAVFPAVIVFFWFRVRKSPVNLPWFLASLAAGIISLFAAAAIQSSFFLPGSEWRGGLGPVFFGIFVRIALVEEASRFLTLVPLLKVLHRRLGRRFCADSALGAAIGLCAGLGFAALENASYGITDINITLLRAFSAAPLHGACGIRAGAAAAIARQHPVKALGLFIFAVLIHGAYNLFIVSPAFPSALAIPTAFIALFASLPLIKSAGIEDLARSTRREEGE